MAFCKKRKGKKGARTAAQRKFKTAAQYCHKRLREGGLPKKGDFKSCMKSRL